MSDRRPSENEEEYFARLEFERKKLVEEEKQDKLAQAEKNKARELHFMKCPKCGMDLIEVNFREVTIDKCSSCNGVWLDAGELDAVTELDKPVLGRLFSVFK